MKELIAYASLGAEHKRLQSLREEKIKEVMKNITDEEYEQMLELAKKTGDEQMVRDLPLMRALVEPHGKERED